MKSALLKRQAAIVAIVLFFAILAAAASILLINGDKLVKVAVVGGIFFPLVLYLSGNPRLFFLVGLVLAAPLGLSINFKTLIHIGGAPSYSVDLADFFLFPLVIFQIRDVIIGHYRDWSFPSINYWWLGLISLGLLNIAMGPLRHLHGFEVMRMVKCMILFVVVVNECKRIKQINYVVIALAAGMCLQVAVGVAQFLLKRSLGLQALGEASSEATKGANLGVYLTENAVYRIGALMGHPNLLSAYLALLLPIFIALFFCHYKRWVKGVLALVIAGGLMALVFTLSRSGWISFAAAFLMLITLSAFDGHIRSKYRAIRVFMIAGTVVAGLAVSGPIIQRITKSDAGAVDFRFEFMVVAVKMVEAKPLLGFGLNTFVYHMAPYTKYQNAAGLQKVFGEHWPAVHNTYLLVWSEQGTLGLVFFIGFLIHVFKVYRQNRRYRVNEFTHALNLGIICGFVAILIDGMASFFIRVPAPGRVFWIVMALLVAINIWNRRNYRARLIAAQRAAIREGQDDKQK